MSGLHMKYFVLKPAGNNIYARASREAMRTYAVELKEGHAGDDEFADELLAWAEREYLEKDAP